MQPAFKRFFNSFRNRQRPVVAAVALLAVAFTPPVLPVQESEEPSQPVDRGFTERATVDLALMEVVVLDKRGRHVRGLPADFFRLLERGEEISLETFDEIDLRPPADDGAADAARTAAAAPAPSPPDAGRPQPVTAADVEEVRDRLQARLSGPRWFVLAFDGYNNVSPLRISQSRKAAKAWIDNNMRSGDMAAIFELTPFLSSVTGFTGNATTLKAGIDRVRIMPGENMGSEMIEQKLEQGDIYSREILQQQLMNIADFAGDLLSAERDAYYGNIRNLSEVLSEFEGTRAIMLFSGGFPITRTRSTGATGGFTPKFRSMLERLDRDKVRIFSFDTGDENFHTSAEKTTNYRTRLDDLGLGTEWLDDMQIGAAIDSSAANQEILAVLGGETGGRFWGGRDYKTGLTAADDDLSHYYLIGYRPKPDPSGKRIYTRIKVEANERGYKVVSRRGRFNSDADSTVDRAVQQTTARANAMEARQEAERAAQPLRISCHPTFYPGANGALAVLPIRVNGPIEPTDIGNGRKVLDMEIAIGAAVGGVEVASTTRNVRLDLDQNRAQLLRSGVHLRDAMLVPAGTMDLEIRVRLNGQGRVGVWSENVSVPVQDPTSFGLAGLTLLDPSDTAPLVFDVFAKKAEIPGAPAGMTLPDPLGTEAGAGRPNSLLRNRFPRSVPLLAQVHVLSPPTPKAGEQFPMRMDWELVPKAGGEALAPPITYRRSRPDPLGMFLDVIIDLDLKAVEPGDYILRLTAVNLETSSEAIGSYELTLTP